MKKHTPRKWYHKEILRWKNAYRIAIKERNELLKELVKLRYSKG